MKTSVMERERRSDHAPRQASTRATAPMARTAQGTSEAAVGPADAAVDSMTATGRLRVSWPASKSRQLGPKALPSVAAGDLRKAWM